MDVFQEAEILRRVPTLAKLDPARLKLLAFTSRSLRFEPGEALMRAGEPSDSVYMILEGTVEVVIGKGHGEIVISTVGMNELMGEMGVLMNGPRTATVRAKGPVRALRISADVFLRLLTENPEVALDVMRQLSERLARSLRRIESLQEHLDECERARAQGSA